MISNTSNWDEDSRICLIDCSDLSNGPQAFADNNLQPAQPKRAFDLWKERQDSPKGRFHNAMTTRAEINRASQQPPKPKKRALGKILGSNLADVIV